MRKERPGCRGPQRLQSPKVDSVAGTPASKHIFPGTGSLVPSELLPFPLDGSSGLELELELECGPKAPFCPLSASHPPGSHLLAPPRSAAHPSSLSSRPSPGAASSVLLSPSRSWQQGYSRPHFQATPG